MNHAVTVGAEQGEIFDPSLCILSQSAHWLCMVSLDVAMPTLSLGPAEIEPASLARKFARHLKHLLLALFD